MKQASTYLGDAEYEHINEALSKSGLTMYAFVKQAVLREADAILGKPDEPEILEQMLEALSERKRYLYQMGPYSDGNHRHWLAGRFLSATKREIAEAVAQWRKAGGTT